MTKRLNSIFLMMDGALLKRQRQLVMAWAEIHQFELSTDWDLLQDGNLISRRKCSHDRYNSIK